MNIRPSVSVRDHAKVMKISLVAELYEQVGLYVEPQSRRLKTCHRDIAAIIRFVDAACINT